VNVRRRFVESTTLPCGSGPTFHDPVYICKNEEIVYSMHVIHRSEALWGLDANEFRLERWEGRKSGRECLPFNDGPRICIRQQFTLTESGYVIVRLVHRVEDIRGVGLPAMGQARHNLSLTNCPVDGVRVQMKMARE
jgi:cytochrome P450